MHIKEHSHGANPVEKDHWSAIDDQEERSMAATCRATQHPNEGMEPANVVSQVTIQAASKNPSYMPPFHTFLLHVHRRTTVGQQATTNGNTTCQTHVVEHNSHHAARCKRLQRQVPYNSQTTILCRPCMILNTHVLLAH